MMDFFWAERALKTSENGEFDSSHSWEKDD